MEGIVEFDAIIIRPDNSAPCIEKLATTPLVFHGIHHTDAQVYRACCMPHPEIHMEHIARGLGPRAWRFQVSFVWARIGPVLTSRSAPRKT